MKTAHPIGGGKYFIMKEVAMRLDYKSIITKHYLLHLSGKEIAEQIGAGKSGVNGFLNPFITSRAEVLKVILHKKTLS